MFWGIEGTLSEVPRSVGKKGGHTELQGRKAVIRAGNRMGNRQQSVL